MVKFKCHFSWQAQYLAKFQWHLSWQAQYLVKFKCHFSWQAQYLVKFGKIAGTRNVVSCLRGGLRTDGNGLGSCSEVFSGTFCQILGGHFAWQAQYLVRLEGDTCCSAHCK